MAEKMDGYCEDWGCPAGGSCKWHWGRSAAYTAMSAEPGRTKLWKGPREPGAESCGLYQRDRVKSWLIPNYRNARAGGEASHGR